MGSVTKIHIDIDHEDRVANATFQYLNALITAIDELLEHAPCVPSEEDWSEVNPA